MQIILGLLAGVVVSCTFIAPATASNWPRFRGPNGTGVAFDKSVPIQWTAKDGIAWKVAIKGIGHASPVVWGDHVFLQSASDDGKERYLLCYSAADGKLLWSQTVTGGRGRTHSKNSLASSTPATDGERVYALFWDGGSLSLHAFDFKGKRVWERGLGRFRGNHGPGASPIVCGDKVILNNDQDGSAALIALDAKTGKTAWEVKRKAYRTCYSTPFLMEGSGAATELVVASTAGISSYDPQTGKELWSWTWRHRNKPLRTVSSPIFHDGMIYAGAGDGDGSRHLVAVKLERGESTRPSLAWDTDKTNAPYVPGMVAWEGRLYFANDSGLAGCYDGKKGTLLWNQRLGNKVTASPILIDGRVYVATERGEVHVFAAEPNYKAIAKNTLGEPVSATPAVAGNRLFIRGEAHLFCIAAAPQSK